ncbi:MAG: ribosome maturation factor RimM [Bifidobacteriaceae bacterium]|jgi:16S rRNA processing protein RimM|nr:ribosome maturation factor RimM [Bifidobacteriaceae bacterium]
MEVVLAVIGRPHGINGEVRLELRTDRPEQRFQPGRVYRLDLSGVAAGSTGVAGPSAPPGQLTLRRYHADQRPALASFDEIKDRTGAESLRGAKLLGEIDPMEEADAWYPAQLRGARAVLPDGTPVGVIRDLITIPGQDLLQIDQPDGTTALVPFVKALVPEVDLDAMRLVIDPPDGLVAARPAAEGE